MAAMDEITPNRLFELYFEALEAACTAKESAREDADYLLFEVFDIGATSFLHDNAIRRLLDASLLDPDQAQMSRRIRRIWKSLMREDQVGMDISEVRDSGKWRVFFDECNRLMMSLCNR